MKRTNPFLSDGMKRRHDAIVKIVSENDVPPIDTIDYGIFWLKHRADFDELMKKYKLCKFTQQFRGCSPYDKHMEFNFVIRPCNGCQYALDEQSCTPYYYDMFESIENGCD